MPTLLLYRFRFRDPIAGRWRTARYVASLADIKARYAEYELLGQPEERRTTGDWSADSAGHIQSTPVDFGAKH